jgi:hypothetical protein
LSGSAADSIYFPWQEKFVSLSTVIVDDEQLARDELAYLLKNIGDVDVVAQVRMASKP